MQIRFIPAVAALFFLGAAANAQDAPKSTEPQIVQDAPKLSEPQIVQVVYAANQADISAAKQALRKSGNREVIAFAQEMVRDHTAINKQALALAKKLSIKPEKSAASRTIMSQAAEKRAELRRLRGGAFDRAYAANEVAVHKKVAGELENTLIPQASNPELKTLLQDGLKIIQGHEQHAQRVVESLQPRARK